MQPQRANPVCWNMSEGAHPSEPWSYLAPLEKKHLDPPPNPNSWDLPLTSSVLQGSAVGQGAEEEETRTLFVFSQLKSLKLYVQDRINNRTSSVVVFRLTSRAKSQRVLAVNIQAAERTRAASSSPIRCSCTPWRNDEEPLHHFLIDRVNTSAVKTLRHPGHELKVNEATAFSSWISQNSFSKLQWDTVVHWRRSEVPAAGAGVNCLLLLLLLLELPDISGFYNEEGFLRCWDPSTAKNCKQNRQSKTSHFSSFPVKLCSLPCNWLYTAPSRCDVITLTEHVPIILPSLSQQKSENRQNCALVHSSLSRF